MISGPRNHSRYKINQKTGYQIFLLRYRFDREGHPDSSICGTIYSAGCCVPCSAAEMAVHYVTETQTKVCEPRRPSERKSSSIKLLPENGAETDLIIGKSKSFKKLEEKLARKSNNEESSLQRSSENL